MPRVGQRDAARACAALNGNNETINEWVSLPPISKHQKPQR